MGIEEWFFGANVLSFVLGCQDFVFGKMCCTNKKAARCPTHRGRYHLAEIISQVTGFWFQGCWFKNSNNQKPATRNIQTS